MKKLLFMFIVLVANATGAMGQQNKNTQIKYAPNGTVKSVEFSRQDKSIEIPRSANAFFTKILKKRSVDSFKIYDKVVYEAGNECFFQYYNNVRVEKGGYTFHYDSDGYMTYAHGNYIDVSNINTTPSISKDEAKEAFIRYLGIIGGRDTEYSAELLIKDIRTSTGESQDHMMLVYKVFLNNSNVTEYGYVDAHTGRVVLTESSVKCVGATGTFETLYEGVKNAQTEGYSDDYYVLHDYSRGAEICTMNLNNNNIYPGYYTEIIDGDNYWHQSELSDKSMALDVHWGLQKIYDRLYNTHNKNSFDDNGYEIAAFIKASFSGNTANACWSSYTNALYFGVGNDSLPPFSSIDIVAHEYGHAITQFQINWTSYESFLEEGLSDIWAMIMKYRISSRRDNLWKIGERVYNASTTGIYDCLRDFENPSSTTALTPMADYYQSTAYNSNSNDYFRSGVFSHWFYLLVNGGVVGSYSFDGVGMNVAENLIVKAVYSGYLMNCDTYPDVCDAIAIAARALGGFSLETAVRNAWYAVGVGNTFMCISGPTIPCSMGIYEVVNLPANSTVSWSLSGIGLYTTREEVPYDPNNNSFCVRRNYHAYARGTVTASILQNGVEVNSVTKLIDTGINFSGTWRQQTSIFNQDTTNVSPKPLECRGMHIINLHQTVILQSSDFIDADITYTTNGLSIINWSNNNGTISFFVGGQSGSVTINGYNSTTCEAFTFRLMSMPNPIDDPILDPILSLGINATGSNYTFTLESEDETVDTRAAQQQWNLSIVQYETGRTMYDGNTTGTSISVNTATWQTGIYIVTATMGDKKVAKKIIIGG